MIDFIPVSEYAHYFDVTVLCMVLTAVWQCHTGSVLKKETVSLNAMWGVLFTLILILYMGLRPVSVYFGDTVNYAKGFYTAANSRDPFSWQWEGEWLFYNLMQWFARYSDIHTFFLLCATVYIGSLWLAMQIILVNDGSTDHSGEICDEYTRKDTRIEVIHQKNAGLSPARNSGMKAAKGKYISFIDGDDYIHPQMYEVLLEALQEGNYSFSMILGKQVYDNDKSYSIPSAYTKSFSKQHPR
jgi:hypothetical protein